MIEIKNLSKTFSNGVQALDRISVQISQGEFVCLLGPSGCGKSTLLRLLAGLESPSEGSLFIDRKGAADLSFVFQDAHLLPWRNAAENIALPLELLKYTLHEQSKMIAEILDLVGLTEFSTAYPNQLSGGMKMRVSLARALVSRPKILLLDEPFAALDEVTRQRLDDELLELWHKTNITVVFVTHSLSEASFLGSRLMVMSKRPGRIIYDEKSSLPQRRSRISPDFSLQISKLAAQFEKAEL